MCDVLRWVRNPDVPDRPQLAALLTRAAEGALRGHGLPAEALGLLERAAPLVPPEVW